MYSVYQKKYPYNNRIIAIEGTFLGDTLYKKNLNPFKFKLAITYCSNLTALIALN
jgi:hypothetical protein